MVHINYLLEPEEDIPSGKTLRTAILFPTVSFNDSDIKYVIDDLFNMLYFSSSKIEKEFDIFKFYISSTTKVLKRNIKYDSEIDKFPMPGKVDYRVAYPLYSNSTGLNQKDLGEPRGKLEQLNDALRTYQWHTENSWSNHYVNLNLLQQDMAHM